MTDFEDPLPPPDEADIRRLLAQYRTEDAAAEAGADPEHLAEAWRDTLDETLTDVVESELERDSAG